MVSVKSEELNYQPNSSAGFIDRRQYILFIVAIIMYNTQFVDTFIKKQLGYNLIRNLIHALSFGIA